MGSETFGGRGASLLATLDRLGRIATGADVKVIAERAAAAIREELGLAHVAVALFDEEAGLVRHLAESSTLTASTPEGHTIPVAEGLVGRAVREGRTVFVADVHADPAYVEAILGVNSELVIPLRAGERIIGVLDCEASEPDVLADRAELMELVASRLAVTLDNARLLREQAAGAAQLARKARELELLNEVARAATSELEPRPMMQRIVDAIRRGFGWEFVALIRVDRAGERFVCDALSTELPTEIYVGYSRQFGSGVVGEVAATGRPIVIDDVRAWPNYVETLPGARSEICVPAIYRGEVVALLNLESQRPAAFHDRLPLLSTVAEQIAGALRMARVNQRLGEQNRLLAELFSRYVAPDLVQVLLTDPERFRTRGERRDVSVMFADIRGFTGLVQRLDSARVLALLNEFYAAMGEAIFGHRGSINRILGDGLMAVFGMPERLADHDAAAVSAALDMQRRVDALSPRWEALTGSPLAVAMAINSGEVTVGSIGDPRHLAFTVVGDVVNVAARLEGEAKRRDARLLVTDRVRAACGDVPGQSLGTIELRGRDGHVGIHQLL